MNAHTPGPWTAQCFLVTAGHDQITHCGGNLPNNRSHEAEANARLIAAAPDLLAALLSAKETIKVWHNIRGNDPTWSIYDARSPEMQIINTALAKAGL